MKKSLLVSFFCLLTLMLFSEAVELDIHELDFGQVTVNTSLTQTVIITSQISQNITLDYTLEDFAFNITPAFFEIEAGQSQAIEITFTPDAENNFSKFVMVSGSVYGNDQLNISGTGIVANIDVDLESYDFGPVAINTVDSTQVTVTNSGSGNLLASISSDNQAFDLSKTNLDISPNNSDSFWIRFSPQWLAEENATITIVSNAFNNPNYEIDLTGSGRSDMSGQVSGIWSLANSPYYIIENTIVPDGQSLTIEPGVEVVFAGHYGFVIEGSLIAQGTVTDSIYFHGQDNVKQGFIVIDDADNEIELNYCQFRYLSNNRYYFSDDFEDYNFADNWTGSGYSYGRTNNDHYQGHYGARVWAYGQDTYIMSRPITVLKSCVISYWFKITSSHNSCNSRVEFRVNGGAWQRLYYTNNGTTYGWTYKEHDISSYVNNGDEIQLRFYSNEYSTDYSHYDQSMYIDEVKVFSTSTIFVEDSIVGFSNSILEHCTGNAIFFEGESNCDISNTSIVNNDGDVLVSAGPVNIFSSKISHNNGNGIYVSSDLTITNTIVSNNNGYGINSSNALDINHAVIANNYDRGIYLDGSDFSLITNSIIYNNDNDEHRQIDLGSGATLNTSYSCVESYTEYGISNIGNFYWGEGCIESYPQFIDCDYHLSPNSPCVDGGFPWEHDGNMPYGLGTVVSDMGAYGGSNNTYWGGNPIPDGAPVIDNIVDLPNDQGGLVGIQFNGSIFDYEHSGYDISHYSFWREMNIDPRTDEVSNSDARSNKYAPRVLTRDGEYWEYVGQVQAQGFENYGYSAETLADSTIYGDFASSFIVIAHTEDDDIYFTSSPLSGSSIDNLAPDQPSRILADGAYGQMTFEWTPSQSEDLHYYKLYRGNEENNWDRSYQVNDTTFVDLEAQVDNQYYYCLKAVDIHGNESDGQSLAMELNYSAYDLHEGANLLSFRFIDEDSSLDNMLADLGSSIVKVIGEGQVAIKNDDGQWIGSLTELTYDKGYWLIMNNEERLELMGSRNTSSASYSLHENANLISYPYAWGNDLASALPDDVEACISAIIGEGQACMRLEDGRWLGSLTHFEKEKAYWVIANQDIELEFNMPSEDRRSNRNDAELPQMFTYKQSANQAFYLTGIVEMNGVELTLEDYLLVYKDDVVIGASKYIGEQTTLAAMGNDGNELTYNYANQGDLVSIKIWKAETNQLYDTNVNIDWANNTISRVEIASVTENDENLILPVVDFVGQNYPNPFNPETTINFGIKKNSHVKVTVYNIKGQKIKTILDQNMKAGYHNVVFEAGKYASGLYLYRIETPDFSETKSMILIK